MVHELPCQIKVIIKDAVCVECWLFHPQPTTSHNTVVSDENRSGWNNKGKKVHNDCWFFLLLLPPPFRFSLFSLRPFPYLLFPRSTYCTNDWQIYLWKNIEIKKIHYKAKAAIGKFHLKFLIGNILRKHRRRLERENYV